MNINELDYRRQQLTLRRWGTSDAEVQQHLDRGERRCRYCRQWKAQAAMLPSSVTVRSGKCWECGKRRRAARI